jgi:hypothetical protein
MTKLKDFLRPIDNFQYSVNLGLDLDDEVKIAQFVPSSSSLAMIADVLASTHHQSTDRARILTGAYGKGKSHLVLTLLGLLSAKREQLFDRLLRLSKQVNTQWHNNIKQYIASKTRLLPVVLDNQGEDIRSTILQGLSKALQRQELQGLMPTTYFDTALAKIEMWEREYPDAYQLLQNRTSVPSLKAKLQQYSIADYKYFESIYPILTSGSKFQPLQGLDILDVLDSVVRAIVVQGYSGIYLVYDEFSKFLDQYMDSGNMSNVKLLQDLAERCSRSGVGQMHLLLIAHKNIESYTHNISKKSVDDWRGISRRFKPISIDNSMLETYDLIASVLDKDVDKYVGYQQLHKSSFDSLRDVLNQLDSNLPTSLVTKVYPLHPYTMVLLPKVAEKLAQNERTIFTFLASHEQHSVSHYVRVSNDLFGIVTPDVVFDYFEQQFVSEPYGSYIRNYWQVAKSAIARLIERDAHYLAIKIIKTISLLYIIGQFDVVAPTLNSIQSIYNIQSTQDVSIAINSIRSLGLLIELDCKPYVSIRELAGNNAAQLLQQELSINKNCSVASVLNAINIDNKYIYPSRYNDKFDMIRYFGVMYVDVSTLANIDSITTYLRQYGCADGYIVAIVPRDELELHECNLAVDRLSNQQVVYAVYTTPIDILDRIARYQAIDNLIVKNTVKKTLTTSTLHELEYLREDIYSWLSCYLIDVLMQPQLGKVDYYCYQQGKLTCNRYSQLVQKLSSIFEQIYNKTPKIINENINRKILSAPMRATRNKIVDAVLAQWLQPNLGLLGSQDIFVLRSVYIVTCIIRNIQTTHPIIDVDSPDLEPNMRHVLSCISNWVSQAKLQPMSFGQLYRELQEPQYGIGMRDGVIPFYIAVVLHEYRHCAIVYNRANAELPLCAKVLNDCNDAPDDYTLIVQDWNQDNQTYVAGLKHVLGNWVQSSDNGINPISAVANGLHKWYLHLSRFDRESGRICDGKQYMSLNRVEKALKKELSQPWINSHELVMVKLPKIVVDNHSDVVQDISNAIYRINNNSANIVYKTTQDIRVIFSPDSTAPIGTILQDWYDSLSKRTLQNVFDGIAARLLDTIQASCNASDDKIVHNLLKNLFGLRLSDFGDRQVDSIVGTIEQAKYIVDKFDKSIDERHTDVEGYSLSYIEGGQTVVKHITTSELPSLAKPFANEIQSLFQEYAGALTTSQKLQVLLQVAKKLI